MGAVCCGVSVEALELAFDAPIPGVIGPRSFSPFEGWGLGASGTACWSAGCCANEAPTLNPENRIAAIARAFKPRSTGILSSHSQPCASRFPGPQLRPEASSSRDRNRQIIRRTNTLQVAPVHCKELSFARLLRFEVLSFAHHSASNLSRCVSPANSFSSSSPFLCSRRQHGDSLFHRRTRLQSATRHRRLPKKSPWERLGSTSTSSISSSP